MSSQMLVLPGIGCKTLHNLVKSRKTIILGDAMPTYGYRCKSCEHSFEVMQSISDKPIEKCPKCDGPVAKIFFPVGISFKGSGFYVTDYKAKKPAVAEKSVADRPSNGCSGGDGASCSGCPSVGVVEN